MSVLRFDVLIYLQNCEQHEHDVSECKGDCYHERASCDRRLSANPSVSLDDARVEEVFFYRHLN